MPLSYHQLISGTHAEQSALLKNASQDEVILSINEAKSAKKPLLGFLFNELMNANIEPSALAPLIDSIKILLEHTQENWDHDFPMDHPKNFGKLSLMANLKLTDQREKTRIEIFAALIYRLSPETLIRELQQDVASMFSSKKSLYHFLVENRALTQPILLAISAVLGQAETQQVEQFKNEFNLILTSGSEAKLHQILLLKHQRLFEDSTNKFLNNASQLKLRDEKFDQYTDMIDYKRSSLSGQGVSATYVQKMIFQPQVFFEFLCIDKLSTQTLLAGLEKNEIAELIRATQEAEESPLLLLLATRENRSPQADQILFQAIVDHAYLYLFLNNKAGNQIFKQLLDNKDQRSLRLITEKIQAFPVERLNKFFLENDQVLGLMANADEQRLRNGSVEEGKQTIKSFWIRKRIEAFKANPNDFAQMLKQAPFLAGRYLECMEEADLRAIMGKMDNFDQALNDFIVEGLFDETRTVSDNPLESECKNLPHNGMYAPYYVVNRQVNHPASLSSLLTPPHHTLRGRVEFGPSNEWYVEATREHIPQPLLDDLSFKPHLIIRRRLLSALSRLLSVSNRDYIPNRDTMTILFHLFNQSEATKKECIGYMEQIYPHIAIEALIQFENESNSTSYNPKMFFKATMLPIKLIVWSLPDSKMIFIDILERAKQKNLLNIMGLQPLGQNIALSKMTDQDLITKLYECYPAETCKLFGALVIQYKLNAPKSAHVPVSSSASNEKDAEIVRLRAELERVTKERDALMAEVWALKKPAVPVAPPAPSSASSSSTYLPSQQRTYNPPVVIEVPIEEDELDRFLKITGNK